ncbi:MAG: phosphatidate cytidylyltransferase [Chloroflexota bacterium]
MERSVLIFIGGLFAVGMMYILFATVTTKDKALAKDLWAIFLTEFAIAGLIIGPSLLGRWALAIVITLLGLLALREFYLVTCPKQIPLLKWSGLVAATIIFVAAYILDSVVDFYGLIFLMGGLFLIIYIFLPVSTDVPRQLGLTFNGLLYPCLCLAHLLLIAEYPQGLALVIFIYCVLETNDSFALVTGKWLGRHKIFPKLSPNKTISGILGGGIAALVVAILLSIFIFDFTWHISLFGTLIIIIFAIIGDLVASKFKRDMNVKDFGNVLPKQGGVLDIYDSLIFVAPVFYGFLQIFQTG